MIPIPLPGIKTVAAIIVAVALAASHWKAYTQGKRAVQSDWDKAVASAQIRSAERAIENLNQRDNAHANRTKTIAANAAAADRARAAADSLRNTSERSLATARESHAACIVSASAHAELFNHCQRDYRDMAKAADGHATDAKALIEAWPK
jgi:hypothetical protein